MGGLRSWRAGAVIAAALCLVTLVVMTPARAGAQAGPSVTVTPSSGLADGDEVEVTTTTPGGTSLFGILQCDASALDDLPSGFSGPCAIRSIEFGQGTRTIRLSGAFRGSNGDIVRCGDEPADCAIVAWSPEGWQAGMAIDMEPTPIAAPSPNQEAGYPVEVIVTGPDGIGATAQLAQCRLPVGPDAASSDCSPLQPLALDADGNAAVPFTLLAGIGDPAYLCGERDCAATLFDGAGVVLGFAPVDVDPPDGPPQMFVAGLDAATDGMFVEVVVNGTRNESFHVAQCAASVADTEDVAGGPCGPAYAGGGDPSSGTAFAYLNLRSAFAGSDGTAVACVEPGDCVVALKGSSGAFSTLPITWDVPDTITIAPQSGLLDGQAITVEGSGLTPGSEYAVLRCANSTSTEYCETSVEDAPKVTASAEGTFTATTTAAQRFTRTDGTREVCRDDCAVVVLGVNVSSVTQAPYTMSTGELTASPAGGLGDGDTVAVTGSGLQPSYDGPQWWVLETGEWALGQCGDGIHADTSVANVFRHCVVPPGGGAVTVAGSTLDASFEAQAVIQPPIGGPIDCTTGPDACAAVLVRVEQDASVTLLSDGLTFG